MQKNSKTAAFKAADVLLILMMVLPIAVGILLKLLFTPESSGVQITGAMIYFTISAPIQPLIITEAQINSWLVMISISGLCLYLTHGIRVGEATRRQYIAEWVVEKCEGLIRQNMDRYFENFAPFIAAMLALSGFSSLLSLTGLFPPTSDLNVVAGWAVLVFILITYYKMKCGPAVYLKGFAEPVKFLAPLNIISEIATPISMAFRHYGNILSGSVVSMLIAAGLQGLTGMLLGHLPGFLGEFPFLRIGLPAVLSIYFDVFSGLLQAYIFAMLTMLYVSDGFPAEEFFKRKKQKAQNA